MIKIAEYTQRIAELKKEVQKTFFAAGLTYNINCKNSNTIRLVFAGQYSAGKSTILKMLTGRTDIAIGAGITTQQAQTYDWNGIEVIDTPGIHTELRPDHDEISYEAIASADMLVFVITNELFDSYMAAHFRKLAIDKDKAGEMILVVNKMARATEGNSPAQREIIREDLRKVLAPFTPEQLNLSFLDAESYLDGLAEMETDVELAEALINRSGYSDFVETLNRFVEEKSITGKLTTELYLIDEQLEKAIEELQPKSIGTDEDELEKLMLQERYLFVESRSKILNEVMDIFSSAAANIRDIGSKTANLLVEGCKQEEVENELNKANRRAKDIAEKCQVEVERELEARLKEIRQDLADIKNSKIFMDLNLRLSGNVDDINGKMQRELKTASNILQGTGQTLWNKAYKTGALSSRHLSSFSDSAIHTAVMKAGQLAKYKFEPWQAAKITKNVAIGGKVLSGFGLALDVFTQVQTYRDEEKIRESLRYNRKNIRGQFNVAANDFEDKGRQYINEVIDKKLNAEIKKKDDIIQSIRNSRANRSASCLAMENLQKECRLLIQEIHSL